MTPEQMKRVREITDQFALDTPILYEDVGAAILAALADPILRQEIENTALEEAAKVCEELRHPNWSEEDHAWIMGTEACAGAIRAMKECGK